MLRNRESTYEWDRHGDPVVDAIMNAADMPEDAAKDVSAYLQINTMILTPPPSARKPNIPEILLTKKKERAPESWQEEWDFFERSLKTEARFFSRVAAQHLASVFEKIDTLKTRDGKSLVVDAGPGTDFTGLSRKSLQSGEKLVDAVGRPDRHLGSPPTNCKRWPHEHARNIGVLWRRQKKGRISRDAPARG